MPKLSTRLNGFTESVIRKMTRISNEYNAINLSQGFPDFDPPKEITDRLKEVADEGPHQYSVTWGAQNFRNELAKKQSKFMGVNINPDENIVVTCGSTEAMMTAMMSLCNIGDKVIVFSPFYENYTADTILSGSEPIYVPLKPPYFNFDKDELRRAFEQKPKAIILCNPSNPTGKVFTKEELDYIAKLAIEFDVFVITDEVYEHLVFPPYKHTYMASLKGMFERTISCSSLSKTYSITGWRLGYVIASKQIIEQCKKVHDFLTVGAAAPLQEAAVVGLQFDQDYYDKLTESYDSKRKLFLDGLDKIGLKYFMPQGAYYVMVDISQFGYKSDYDFAVWLIKNIGVAGVPGSSFFKEDVNNYIRFHFAKKEETLKEALKRLEKLKEYIN
ncbi:MAG: pyridoxal phosphate-dependent aminotransferase [Clostridium butyricum]|uniref:Aminotransferase n=1 Tax=Clostridium butyricum TaxID=1492 RepID=A0A6L9EPP5_CLOBU|nr:pyridoxal phosphate-dependent aminotransferase [Clostridium butyricum]MDU1004600.1 pyridoxal phosphate-dependent aminotransferase [Clostridium butyricum]MDU1507622.1 pyridoxal phosphate-dependent aminotransferase [Clostridium butyricum]MDU4800630.1 pyridoxal phosphate-dependent aminotransferase [Clostridium butyricum]MDU5721765.1 pyridoxal phosphate-dependent aminotransferase [Clostridium butyricum]MDU5819834.1 pyridoxal phosphate-dependent aminotransferase [Clostridium butyricum]